MEYSRSLWTRWLKVSLPNKLTVLCTFVIAIATVWYAIAAHKQWSVMTSQLEQIRGGSSQTDRLIEEATKQSKAALDAANTARLALDIARNNFAEGRRPYIWITDTTSPQGIAVGRKISWTFHLGNFGQSPALRGKLRKTIATGTNCWDRIDDSIFKPAERTAKREPNELGFFMVPNDLTMFQTAYSAPLRQADIESLSAGGCVAMAVHVEYFDTIGNKYSTEICRFLRSGWPIMNCPRHNGVR